VAALAALRRLAPPSVHGPLDQALTELVQRYPAPAWLTASPPRATAAWRAVDVWDSERVLFVEYPDGPRPHTLLALVSTVGGVLVDKLALLEPGAAARWEQLRDPDDVPMPLQPAAVDDVLAELADALQHTDITWPRTDDDDVVDLRALAWSRCRDQLPPFADLDALTAAEEAARTELEARVEEFVGLQPAPVGVPQDVVRSLAELFGDYGLGYISAGPLAWSPMQVMLFLTDWLPRKAVLDAAQREHLAPVLKAWLRFALTGRGVAETWIAPVLAAVDEHHAEFAEAFDDTAAWGPAKHLMAELAAQGVDLTDREAVEQGLREANARRLARMLSDDREP